ncbi:MAG TPA: hypothetical protein VF135_03305 [Terriglobales bacterium]
MRELALAEASAEAQVPDSHGNGQMISRWHRRGGLWHRLNDHWLGFIVQGSFAAAAEIVICPELDKMAMVASYYFPGIYRC